MRSTGAEGEPKLQQMMCYSRDVERIGQSEKSGPTAGKRAKPTAGRSIKRNEKSRANCRQRIDREEQLRAYPTAGTVWPESQDSEVREQDEDGQGYQSDAEGVTRRQCEVHVSQEGQAQ